MVGAVEQEYEPTSVEEKHKRRNEIKARATLLMTLRNKDQLKFHTYQDAKFLIEAIEKRYGRNKESKKVHMTLLKQQYENFAALSFESIDQTFDRNKAEIETISLEDLYNNLKIYEPELTEDLEQLHHDDLEEMDLQWEMAMLTIKARRFIKRTRKKLNIDGQRNDQLIDKFKKGLRYNAATAASPTVEGFENLTDKSGSDKAYHTVPPPLTGNFIPRKPDPNFAKMKLMETNIVALIIEDWNSNNESKIDYTIEPSIEKTKFVKTVRETDAAKQNPRGNQRNWNNLMSQRLGNDFKMTNKACYTCGSFKHLHYVCDKKVARPAWNNSRRVNHKNFSNKMSHPQYDLGVVTPRALVHAGVKTSGDARSWYMISGDAKSWFVIVLHIFTVKLMSSKNDQGVGANGGVGANRGVDGVPDFSIIISQQLQNLSRNGSLKGNNEKRGNDEEPSRSGNVRHRAHDY
ncbi:hypothetical protein Tco_0939178 [Tanacetum coccineum]|uniref:Uncharacterized protein n=1 Tax=Tanacetum coccineum TaxID=301880 RepID=A0ABQ5DLZ8_9ASTR